MDGEGLDAIVITASGCGTTIKDYGFMFRDDPAYAEKAARVSALAKDVTEYVDDPRPHGAGARDATSWWPITPPARCSTASRSAPSRRRLLKQAGFTVKDVPEGHICCGSAGTYNILQPEIAGAAARPQGRQYRAHAGRDLIATGNIGCMTQIGNGTEHPDRPHGRAARLGDRRADAGNPGGGGLRKAGLAAVNHRSRVRLLHSYATKFYFQTAPRLG